MSDVSNLMTSNPGDLDDAQKQQIAAAVGLDWNSVDWGKVLKVVKFIFDLFNEQQPIFAASGHPDADVKGCLCRAICLNCCAIEEMVAHLESHQTP